MLPKEILRVERLNENDVPQASVTIRIAEREVTIKVMNQGLCCLRCSFAHFCDLTGCMIPL